jgi:hypothetical protein
MFGTIGGLASMVVFFLGTNGAETLVSYDAEVQEGEREETGEGAGDLVLAGTSKIQRGVSVGRDPPMDDRKSQPRDAKRT